MREWVRTVVDIMSADPHTRSIKLNGELIWNGSEKEEEVRGMRNEGEHGLRPRGEVVCRLSDFDEGRGSQEPSSGEVDLSGGRGEVDEATEIQSFSSRGDPLSTVGRGRLR